MGALAFQHVAMADLWSRCDFDRLRIEPATQTVRLAALEAVDEDHDRPGTAAFDARRDRVGGAVAIACRPDLCAPGVAVLADPVRHGLFRLAPSGWISLMEPAVPAPAGPFRPRAPEPGQAMTPAALQADAFGRVWLWDRAANRLLVLDGGSLQVLAEVLPPATVTIGAVAVWAGGVLIADSAAPRLWQRPPAGDWSEVPLDAITPEGAVGNPLDPYTAIAGSGHPRGAAYLLLRPDDATQPCGLLVLDATGLSAVDLDELEDPLYLLALPDGVLIGEAFPAAGHTGLHLFFRYVWSSDSRSLTRTEVWAVRGFDGRALYLDHEDAMWATTADGARRLFESAPRLASEGILETYTLDSNQYGCAWHRVFLDVCLPRNTTLAVYAKTSDARLPEALRRDPRPPAERLTATMPMASEPQAVSKAWADLPLGSRTPDDWDEWLPVGLLDRREAYADRPFFDADRALPSEDLWPRAAEPQALPLETLEGLIKNPKGRFLWLRIVFDGDSRRSPALKAVRTTFVRPSLLNRLPAYWRADEEAAGIADRALALFEAFDTELNDRISAIPGLLDPANCPADVLDWLAGFTGLVFDTRLSEAVRRQLLLEAAWLYRMRGTVPAMERLCTILAEAPVVVVEGFRLRRSGGVELGDLRRHADGTPVGVLGGAVRLGSAPGGDLGDEAWEMELRASFEDSQPPPGRPAGARRSPVPAPRPGAAARRHRADPSLPSLRPPLHGDGHGSLSPGARRHPRDRHRDQQARPHHPPHLLAG